MAYIFYNGIYFYNDNMTPSITSIFSLLLNHSFNAEQSHFYLLFVVI